MPQIAIFPLPFPNLPAHGHVARAAPFVFRLAIVVLPT